MEFEKGVEHGMRFKTWILFTLIIMFCMPRLTMAFVYQCVSQNGKIEYRDAPCISPLQTQSYLPIQYSNKQSEASQYGASVKNPSLIQESKNKESKNKIASKKEASAKRKEARLKAKEEKLAEQNANKEKRRKERCAKLDEKIDRIESELRLGCKLKRFNRLKQELEHCRKMKQKNCSKTV